MKTRHPLLPIAVALAACLWTSDAMTQAGAMPPGARQGSPQSIPVAIATHSTGEHPGTGERPGSAQPAAGASLDSAAALRRQALTAMEMLREEIATLAALKNAQAALLAWNRDLAEADVEPATLAEALCNDPALTPWCPLLPATFGTSYRGEDHDRD